MSGAPPDAAWLNALIGLLQAAQLGLLRALHAVGLVDTVHGQPAWPWARRFSGEYLLIDIGQARHLAITLALLAGLLVLLGVALFWRRRRWWVLALVPLILVLAPWPEARVVLVPAHPTSFHAPPAPLSVASIEHGRALYAQQCIACHGANGRGQGPLAAEQPVWPPNLAGPLLWRRADGDLLWAVLHGTRDRMGRTTMRGHAGRLTDADAWATLDFLRAQAAGEMLRASGSWMLPVALPDMPVRCGAQAPRALSSWRGQRVRVVAAASGAAPAPAAQTAQAVREDPRLVTVWLRPPTANPSAAGASASLPGDADCVADDARAWSSFALVAGTQALEGAQFLADRDGWLRARSQPGQAGWSEDDLVCRTDAPPRAASPTATPGKPPADGLGALITLMDAEPVRFVKGGFVH
ncbi:MAG: cytochrome c [Comamonadaceae bacterium]|nr:MAG: cytochrome c [Comamonadaceae bacterium]